MNKRIGAKSIAEIKKEFETADRTERKKLQMLYASDERSGVKNLIHRYLREEEKLLAEEERTEAMKCYEELMKLDVGRWQVRSWQERLFFRRIVIFCISMIRKSCLPGSGKNYTRSL
mgnify:CR=1 FL=1